MTIIQDSNNLFESHVSFGEVPPAVPFDSQIFPAFMLRIIMATHYPTVVASHCGENLAIKIVPYVDEEYFHVKIATQDSLMNINPNTSLIQSNILVWSGSIEDIKNYLNFSNIAINSIYKYKNKYCIILPKQLNPSEWLQLEYFHPCVLQEHGELFIKNDANKILNEFY